MRERYNLGMRGSGSYMRNADDPYTCVVCGATGTGPKGTKTCPPSTGRDCRERRKRWRDERAEAKKHA